MKPPKAHFLIATTWSLDPEEKLWRQNLGFT